ncbi:MAG: glycine cleavage system protein H [Candidatus Saccharicenans sp.]|nr:glycine cleavage system protein H [Candidatus Saccharicenans sp.]
MAIIRGCNLPEDLFYYPEKHLWLKPLGGNLFRVGLTPMAGKLSGGKLNAVTIRSKNMGNEVQQGKSLATLESSKYVGPVPAPITGIVRSVNERLASEPNLVISDPYGEGWVVEMEATRWEEEKAALLTGPEGLAEYQKKLEAAGISCD